MHIQIILSSFLVIHIDFCFILFQMKYLPTNQVITNTCVSQKIKKLGSEKVDALMNFNIQVEYTQT